MSIHLDTMLFAFVNFFVLLFILRKFAYGPLMGMLDARREEVVNNLSQAEEAKNEAQRLKDEYAAHIKDAKHEAQEIINKANTIGEQTKNEIINEARAEAVKLTEKAQAEINREKAQAINELRNEVADLAVLAAEKVIAKSIDKNDHVKMVNDFVKEVGDAK